MSEQLSKRALIVDDDQPHVRRLVSLLYDEGLEHAHMHTGGGAEELLLGETFRLVIVNEDLPDTGGLEVAAAVRKASPGTPVIVTTSRPTRIAEKAAAALGVSEYLTKPLNLERTALRIRRLLMHSLPPPMPVTRSSVPPRFSEEARDQTTAGRMAELRVVVVEPTDDLRESILEALTAIGCAATAFRTATRAHRQVTGAGFDLIVADPGVVAESPSWVTRHAGQGRSGVIAVMEAAGVDPEAGAIRLSTRGVIMPPFERRAVRNELRKILLQYAANRWR